MYKGSRYWEDKYGHGWGAPDRRGAGPAVRGRSERLLQRRAPARRRAPVPGGPRAGSQSRLSSRAPRLDPLRRRGGLRGSLERRRRRRDRSEEHTSELQSQSNLVCRLLLEKKKNNNIHHII